MTEEFVNKQNDELDARIKKAIDELEPFFDSIQFFAVRHVNSEIGTVRFSDGRGDFFSRYGYVNLWVKNQKLANGDE